MNLFGALFDQSIVFRLFIFVAAFAGLSAFISFTFLQKSDEGRWQSITIDRADPGWLRVIKTITRILACIAATGLAAYTLSSAIDIGVLLARILG